MLIKRYASVLAFTGMLCAVQGQGLPEWTAVASTCVPDETSLGGRLAMTNGKIHFGANVLGEIEARCNVTNPRDNNLNPGWNRMEITYSDPDGMAGVTQVLADLVRVDKFTGASVIVDTFDSNGFPAAPFLRVSPFNHVFDFINAAYFVDLRVRRANANLIPGVARVRLFRD